MNCLPEALQISGLNDNSNSGFGKDHFTFPVTILMHESGSPDLFSPDN